MSGGGVDTIVAPCTAAGAGERAVVRLSGPAAHRLADTVAPLARAPEPGVAGRARLDLGGVELPVTVLRWWAPRSLTGEDVTELHLPGWPAAVTELVERLRAAGARLAAPGEFTRRAVAAGKLDLDGVAALDALLAARDAAEAGAAASRPVGESRRLAESLRDGLLDTLALLEAHVDFEEEDTGAVTAGELVAGLDALSATAARAAARGRARPAADGATDLVLLGPTNAGKSLLARRLSPAATPLVSATPATTRDRLEAPVTHGGRAFRVHDGPGLLGADAGGLDAQAVARHLASLPEDAVVLLVEDVTAPPADAGRARLLAAAGGRPVLRVLNKVDLLDGPAGPAAAPAHPADPAQPAPPATPATLRVSALEGTGLDALWAAVHEAAPRPPAPDLAARAAAAAADELRPLLEAVRAQPPEELAADLPRLSVVLRDALDLLEASEDRTPDRQQELLDRILSGFCIGK